MEEKEVQGMWKNAANRQFSYNTVRRRRTRRYL